MTKGAPLRIAIGIWQTREPSWWERSTAKISRKESWEPSTEILGKLRCNMFPYFWIQSASNACIGWSDRFKKIWWLPPKSSSFLVWRNHSTSKCTRSYGTTSWNTFPPASIRMIGWRSTPSAIFPASSSSHLIVKTVIFFTALRTTSHRPSGPTRIWASWMKTPWSGSSSFC